MILPMRMHTDLFSLEISPVDMSANCFSCSPQLYGQVSGADFQPRFDPETVHCTFGPIFWGGRGTIRLRPGYQHFISLIYCRSSPSWCSNSTLCGEDTPKQSLPSFDNYVVNLRSLSGSFALVTHATHATVECR